MARIGPLEKLFAAVAAQDWPRARAHALSIADEEDANRHTPAARRLRAALGGTNGSARAAPINGRAFQVEQALTLVVPACRLAQVTLPPAARKELTQLVEEWGLRARLDAAGVRRRTRILLHGPPGCGKSLSAAALGTELGLPVEVVRLDAVVGSFLGETAGRVHELLHRATHHPSVLVLDEIDALARRRGRATDVAELDRVVVALLQELEHTTPAGLLVATTNRIDELDDALFRRFDVVLELPRPNATALRAFARAEAASLGVAYSAEVRAAVRAVNSFAAARRVIEDSVRRRVLGRKDDR